MGVYKVPAQTWYSGEESGLTMAEALILLTGLAMLWFKPRLSDRLQRPLPAQATQPGCP